MRGRNNKHQRPTLGSAGTRVGETGSTISSVIENHFLVEHITKYFVLTCPPTRTQAQLGTHRPLRSYCATTTTAPLL
jgi:hypothetical protein